MENFGTIFFTEAGEHPQKAWSELVKTFHTRFRFPCAYSPGRHSFRA